MKSLREEMFDTIRGKCISDDIALIATDDLLEWFSNPNHNYSIVDNKHKKPVNAMKCKTGKIKKACVNCVNNGTNCKISIDTEEIFYCNLFNTN